MKRKLIESEFFPNGHNAKSVLKVVIRMTSSKRFKEMTTDQKRECVKFLEKAKENIETCIEEIEDTITV